MCITRRKLWPYSLFSVRVKRYKIAYFKKKSMKAVFTLLASCAFSLLTLAIKAQTTYSVLSTAYDRSSGGFYSLGSIDSDWFLTETQDLVVPNDPSSIITYSNAATYVVPNSGNNTFTGIISDHSINYNASTTSQGSKLVTYRTYFTLPNLNATADGYSLSFKMSADDAVNDVKLNVTLKGQFLDANYNNIPGVDKPYLLTIPVCDTSFRSGQNIIDVTIADAGGSIGFYGEITLFKTSSACTVETGINEHGKLLRLFSVSPNPAANTLNIDASDPALMQNLLLKIYSVDGRLLKTQSITGDYKHSIDVDELANGLYYLNISAGDDSQTLKFIKE